MAAVELVGVTKRFGSQTVVDEVSLAVEDGEFFSLLGPSGSGKSTLLRIVSGLERPDGGEVRFDGRRVDRVDPSRRGVGFVFQSYALFPHLSVFDNIAFGLQVRRVARAEQRRLVEEVAGVLDIAHLLGRRPRELSGGERQRVALGRAIVRRPRVLLMDEPLSNLDALLRERMRVELRRLHDRLGVTTIYVTHDQREALSMSDRLLVLNAGRIEQEGTPLELLACPRTLFAARFTASPAMNIWPGSISLGPRRVEVESELGRWELTGIAVDPGAGEPGPLDGRREVAIGVRPHDLRLESAAPEGRRGRIEVVEPTNTGLILHVGGLPVDLVAFVAGTSVDLRVGQEVAVAVDGASLHLFDVSTGRRIDVVPDGRVASGGTRDGAVDLASVGWR
jgi:ABC-type sugar transport system ATPase subunit